MMQTQSTSGFIISLLLAFALLAPLDIAGQTAEPADTAAGKKQRVRSTQHQLRLGIDMRRIVENIAVQDRYSYEASLDYLLNDNEAYAVIEGGFGGADFTRQNLTYGSKNSFAKLGIDKGLLKRIGPGDWDGAFIGARYGVAFIERGDATYTTTDSLWGPTTGTTAGRSFTGHWAEIVAGLRLELLPRFFAGWNVRGKFLLNPKSFAELPPAFIAGYGRGDKSAIFDFNFYLLYALRW